MNKNTIYQFQRETALQTIVDRIKESFVGLSIRPTRGEKIYYDSFDWRLYNHSLRLYTLNQELFLASNKDSGLRVSVSLDESFRFVSDIPSERMVTILEPIVEVRALLPVIRLHVHGKHIDILDELHKTVARVFLQQVRVAEKNRKSAMPLMIILHPIKGYVREFNDLEKLCRAENANVVKEDLLEQALRMIGRRPGEYSSKIHSDLDPAMPAAQAVQKIFSQLLHVMRLNEYGVIEDLDIEFLHDYRVAVRRIRSLFGQIKNVFQNNIYRKAKQEFTEIGKSSNRLRDIDVYLLRESSYMKLLPENNKYDISMFFNNLRKTRKNEHRKIVKQLHSKKYKDIIDYWLFFTEYPLNKIATPNGRQPIVSYAQNAIRKRYLKIIALGNTINRSTDDLYLHQLRIECKKLRYLLEFFASLFSRQKINVLIRHLKKLQDNLGAFNDLSVQQAKLSEFAHTVVVEDAKNLLLATGILIGRLNQEQVEIRHEFSSSFAQFSTPEMTELFELLFNPKMEKEYEDYRHL